MRQFCGQKTWCLGGKYYVHFGEFAYARRGLRRPQLQQGGSGRIRRPYLAQRLVQNNIMKLLFFGNCFQKLTGNNKCLNEYWETNNPQGTNDTNFVRRQLS